MTGDGRTERDPRWVSIESMATFASFMQGIPVIPLSPAPSDLVLAHTSRPWSTVRAMLGLVGLLFLITNMAPLYLAGLLDADFNGTLGPTNPWMIIGSSLCSVPVLALMAFLRRPACACMHTFFENRFERSVTMKAFIVRFVDTKRREKS